MKRRRFGLLISLVGVPQGVRITRRFTPVAGSSPCLGSSVGPPAPTNENTNGLLRQYFPKRQSMAHLTQHDCNRIAAKLNRRPRKRLGHLTPEECYTR